MKVAVLGYGIEGKISAQYWQAKGDIVTVCDKNENAEVPSTYQTQLGENYLNNLDEFDLIVRTAGMHPRLIAEANSEAMSRVTTSLNEFVAACPSQNIIGITGTKGKGTTATLAAKMLEADGKRVHVGGNIGKAPLELLSEIQSDHWVVLELSSFQLIDFKQSIKHTVCLSITAEHLNWHADLDEYIEAKAQLFRSQDSEGTVVYNADSTNALKIVEPSQAKKVPYSVGKTAADEPSTKTGAYVLNGAVYFEQTQVCKVDEVALPGHYNLQNVCAAVAVVWPIIDGNIEAIKQAVGSFKGLPHHFEVVRDLDGVTFVNDAYATAQDSTIAAVQVYSRPTVLILGGNGKGVSFDPMLDAIVKSSVKHIVLIGQLAEEFKTKLAERGFTSISMVDLNLPEIVAEARRYAQPGDVILLSQGGAIKAQPDSGPSSGPTYKDNVEFGTKFKELVNSL